MTDERAHPDVVSMIERLPKGPPILIVFRHYGLGPMARAALLARVGEAASGGGHLVTRADRDEAGGRAEHNAPRPRPAVFTSGAAHTIGEGLRRGRTRTDVAFVSPVFPTQSHPSAPALGPARADAIARALPMPAFALGGLTGRTAKRLEGTTFTGLAAVGAFGRLGPA